MTRAELQAELTTWVESDDDLIAEYARDVATAATHSQYFRDHEAYKGAELVEKRLGRERFAEQVLSRFDLMTGGG